MALRIIDTEDATYYLGLGNHAQSSALIFRNVDFSQLDFMVFEDCGSRDMLAKAISTDPQYSDVYWRLMKENPSAGIYGVDVTVWGGEGHFAVILEAAVKGVVIGGGAKAAYGIVTKRNELKRRQFLKEAGIFFLGTGCLNHFLVHFNCGETEKLPLNIPYNNFWSNILPSPAGGFRDAVAVKKISQYLVPKHKRESGKKRVQGAILYGIGHSGIETKLRHPWIADATLFVYRHLFRAASKEDLNEMREVVNEDWGTRRTLYSDCGLFR